jgi:hypothetical protein
MLSQCEVESGDYQKALGSAKQAARVWAGVTDVNGHSCQPDVVRRVVKLNKLAVTANSWMIT